ncbi:MAG: hypothetical protein JWO97_3966 [Acidobacteria bacterium]|nr:hypothetical protein [Acidobacteriota bacterium]
MRRILLLMTFLAIAGTAVAAEDPNTERGVQPGKAYHIGEIDQINVFNGHLNVTIPVGQTYHVNGGLTYGFTLHFNSSAWEIGTALYDFYDHSGYNSVFHNYAYPSLLANAGFGWTLSLGSLDLDPSACCTGAKAYRGSDGAQHDMYPRLHFNNDVNEANYVSQTEPGVTNVAYTNDGTYLREKTHREIDGTIWYEIDFPDGTVHQFNAAGRLTQMADQFGNRVTVEYLPAGITGLTTKWQFREYPAGATQYARENFVYFRSAPNVEDVAREIVDHFDLAAFNATTNPNIDVRAIYSLTYSPSTSVMSRPCTPADLPSGVTAREGKTVNMQTLLSVALLDANVYSSVYSMVYDVGNGTDCSDKFAGSYSGTLRSIKVPTGGTIAYDYQLYHFPQAIQQRGQGYNYVPGVKTRTVLDFNGTNLGATSYSPVLQASSPPARELVNTVTETSGQHVISKTRNYFGVCAVYQGTNPEIPEVPFQACINSGEYGLPFTHDVAAHPAVDGRFLSTELFEPAANGADVLKRSTYVRYEADGTMYLENTTSNTAGVSFGNLDANRRLASSSTVFEDGKAAITDFSEFDGLGHYRKSDVSSSSGWGATHTSYTLFNPAFGVYGLDSDYVLLSGFIKPATNANWILDTYSTQYEKEGSHSAATYSCFDSLGFLTRRRELVADNPGNPKVTPLSSNDLIAVFTPDGLGNMTQEEYFGGDVANNAPTSGYTCGSTLPANSYDIRHTYESGTRKSSSYFYSSGSALSFKTRDVDIDKNTGYVSIARERADASGTALSTAFTYDLLGRLTNATPDSAVTQGARVSYAYTDGTSSTPATVTSTTYSSNGLSTLKTQTMTFDGLGRLTSETSETSTGAPVMRLTEYNHLGWKLRVSELEPSSLAPSARHFTTFSYDYAGRPVTVHSPDDKEVTMAYTGASRTARTVRLIAGNTAATAAEQDVTTTENYDRDGRLISVTEPSGTITNYSYDLAGRLSDVCMNAAGGSCGQVRTFVYDNRGFLLRETHPEKGANGNGTSYYGSYDARGHVGNRYDAVQHNSSDVSFIYDRAERLKQVNRTSDALPLKIFTFGDSNEAPDSSAFPNLRNGQLLTATRFNWFVDANADPKRDLNYNLNVEITETYTYRGKEGRVSKRVTDDYECTPTTDPGHCLTPGSGVLKRSFSQVYGYDDLGAPTAIAYPAVTFSGCGSGCPTAPSAPTVTNYYSRGFLTGVEFPYGGSSLSNTITYHPSGMVATVTHSNSVVDTIEADLSGMPRPRSISATGGVDATTCTAPSISAHPASASIASGASTILTVTASGDQDHTLTYQWYERTTGDTTQPISGATSPSKTANPTVTTSYWVRVSNGCGTPADSATAVVTVCSAPLISAHPQAAGITIGQSATLSVAASGSGNSVQWYRGPASSVTGPILGATGASLTVAPVADTTYWARVTNSCGAADSSGATVYVMAAPTAPTSINAVSDGINTDTVTWSGATAAAGFARYDFERASDGQPYAFIGSAPPAATNYLDQPVTPGKAYAYRIFTVDVHGARSPVSPADATVVMTFTDDPVVAASVISPGVTAPGTAIKAIHVTELRRAINAMRVAAGLPVAWQTEAASGHTLRTDILEMRTYLDEARAVLLLPQLIYTYPALTRYVSPIRAADVNDLRSGVK